MEENASWCWVVKLEGWVDSRLECAFGQWKISKVKFWEEEREGKEEEKHREKAENWATLKIEKLVVSLCPSRSLRYWLFLETSLKDEVLKIVSVLKHTWAAQWIRFKEVVATGNYSGCISLGVKCSEEVTTVTHETIILPKISNVPFSTVFSYIHL